MRKLLTSFLRLQTAREIKCSSPSPAGISVARPFAHLVSVHHMRKSGTETVTGRARAKAGGGCSLGMRLEGETRGSVLQGKVLLHITSSGEF